MLQVSLLCSTKHFSPLGSIVIEYIMVYGSTPYVGMAPKKIAAALKVHKWPARNVCVRLVQALHEPYQALPSVSIGNGTIKFAAEYH